MACGILYLQINGDVHEYSIAMFDYFTEFFFNGLREDMLFIPKVTA